METQGCLFDERFLNKYVGKSILCDSKIAVMELVANAWDAGATRVDIAWPDSNDNFPFSIQDNGVGMNQSELLHRWRMLAYNRQASQGEIAECPPEFESTNRKAFGRNGVGRFAGFCFGESYFIDTVKEGKGVVYQVSQGAGASPFTLDLINKYDATNEHGTKIFVEAFSPPPLTSEQIKTEIGMRFLTEPLFEVFVNNDKVHFNDIPDRHINHKDIELDGIGTIKITIIDTFETDKTANQHGIAWHVNGRLVGECSWKSEGFKELIDERRIAAKRYTFIIKADFLADAVSPDWTGFDTTNHLYKTAYDSVYREVRAFVLEITKGKRESILKELKEVHQSQLIQMAQFKRKKWATFVCVLPVSLREIPSTG
nr:ATP-binding protein [uncultured Desulfobacter sp.]